ncbi:hypothetical protein [Exiguobacterium sp. AM39-5BH]|uniref:hypothetical protein n=1 Tax=Exiguobacterium sp. AM39-5BH TaxID=2292355 RepID=UPI000FE1F9CF|nr:hypothetical protein [Exiguobacterium sp. AM39-5BH]
MRRFGSAYGWMMVAALLLGGCDEQQRVVNGNEPADDEAIAIAWAYVTARNWQEPQSMRERVPRYIVSRSMTNIKCWTMRIRGPMCSPSRSKRSRTVVSASRRF